MAIEAGDQIANMMVMDPYPGFDGKYFKMPCRNVLPKPVQSPHPPMWMACTNRDTIKVAASLGVGALAFAFVNPEEARAWADIYYGIIASDACVPLGHSVNANIAMVSSFSIHHDRAEAIRRGHESFEFFGYALNALVARDTVPGRTNLWGEYLALRGNRTEELARAAANAPQGGGIGTPDDMRVHLRAFQDAGVDQVIFMQQEAGAHPLPSESRARTQLPQRRLGKTGVMVSRIGLGGAHIGKQSDEQESIRIIRTALDHGVSFLDNCWDYNGGKREERMGKALRDGYRQKAFLMTKLDGRTKDIALAQLDQSLKRLQTDGIDLVQIHEIIRMGDPAACFRAGGCIEVLVEAKKAGKIRFIGFTGHKDPEIHLAMLAAADAAGFAFDTVQMPMNVMDAHYQSFEKRVLPVLLAKDIGVLSMKAIGAGDILKSGKVSAVE